MKKTLTLINLCLLFAFVAGNAYAQKHHAVHSKHKVAKKTTKHSHKTGVNLPEVSLNNKYPVSDITTADSLLQFAQTLIGTPYREASSNPQYGFDCSGFVSYVFKNFDLKVPRSSSEYYNAGERISLENAKPGDLILFTGTKTYHKRSIGHIGIICANDEDGIKFIHSTSGKEHGVTITDFNDTYKHRFVQIVRLLKNNSEPVEALSEEAATATASK